MDYRIASFESVPEELTIFVYSHDPPRNVGRRSVLELRRHEFAVQLLSSFSCAGVLILSRRRGNVDTEDVP